LSFWGGINLFLEVIIAVHHELCGKSIKNRIFFFPRGAGSSSGCGVIMEMVRCNTNPAAIINIETESILALGSIIAEELYHKSFPIVNIEESVFNLIQTGDYIE
jgi:predicted aconitase with swiveling domain